jgi:hypothetical protein
MLTAACCVPVMLAVCVCVDGMLMYQFTDVFVLAMPVLSGAAALCCMYCMQCCCTGCMQCCCTGSACNVAALVRHAMLLRWLHAMLLHWFGMQCCCTGCMQCCCTGSACNVAALVACNVAALVACNVAALVACNAAALVACNVAALVACGMAGCEPAAGKNAPCATVVHMAWQDATLVLQVFCGLVHLVLVTCVLLMLRKRL